MSNQNFIWFKSFITPSQLKNNKHSKFLVCDTQTTHICLPQKLNRSAAMLYKNYKNENCLLNVVQLKICVSRWAPPKKQKNLSFKIAIDYYKKNWQQKYDSNRDYRNIGYSYNFPVQTPAMCAQRSQRSIFYFYSFIFKFIHPRCLSHWHCLSIKTVLFWNYSIVIFFSLSISLTVCCSQMKFLTLLLCPLWSIDR